jgi:hypothetical protein
MKAKLFTLNKKDFWKGLILAVITAIITFLTNELQSGTTINLELFKRVGLTSLIAFLSYLVKNLFTNSSDQFATSETKPS